MADLSTRFQLGNKVGRIFKPGNEHRWPAGTSGNPAGGSRSRREFERAFYSALIGEGTAEEAAQLLWGCARAKEPWAVQLLLQRLAPQDSKIRLEVTRGSDEGFDASRLSDGQLNELIRLIELADGQTEGQVLAIEGGEMPAESGGVPSDGVAGDRAGCIDVELAH